MSIKQLTRYIACSIGALLGASASWAQEASNLGEVIVTAQKRNEALDKIPMSVSVVAGDALERGRAVDFQDLTALVPGLSVNSNTPGVSRITLRGINTGGVASTVGVYVNDVPFGSSSGLANGAILSGDFDTFDMNRIEVLRGPQGTLYGASSLGGVIKYVANEPSLKGFEGRVQGSLEDVESGDLGYAVTGVLNIPAGETFAVRASGFYRSDDGFIDSIGNNPIPSLTDPNNNIVDGSRVEDKLNGLETYGGRLSALFQPSDDFSINVTALYQKIDSDNSDIYEGDPDTFHPLYGGLVVSRYHPEPTDTEYQIYSATLDWNFGAASLQSITSYGEFKETFQRDLALLPVAPGGPALSQLLTFLLGDPATNPISGIQNQVTSTDKFTQELRLVSPQDDEFEWLAGVYYTHEDSAIDQIFTAVHAGTENPDEQVPPPVPLYPVIGIGKIPSTYKEIAVFANATWHITQKFDLSFGGRWSDNDQEASQTLDGLLAGGTLTQFNNVKSSESPFTWSVSPRYEFTDTTSMYARVATGFRPGGPNILPPNAPAGTPTSYASDELTNYELGLKTRTEDGRFAFDIAAYYLDWKDIQLFVQINNVGLNANGGKAKSQGLEFTASANPVSGLSLTLTGAYTKAELTEDTGPIVGGLDGDSLPWIPDYSFGLNADYEWNVFTDAKAYVGGLVSYTGKRDVDFLNRDANGDVREVDAYTTLDLRTGITWDRWSIELYAKNVTDEEGITDVVTPGPFPNGAAGIGAIRPRTIGLSLGARF
jgi:outer membrane receptor protein involved in Fe transport